MNFTELLTAEDPDAALDEFLSEPDPAVVETVAGLTGPVLVLGAGGKMGLHLCLMLHRALRLAGNQGARVVAVSRFSSLRSEDIFKRAGIETWAADLSNQADVDQLPDCATLFFLAGVKFGTRHDPALLQRMNVDLPRLVGARFPHARWVVFSTGCVYPFVAPETGGATESMAPDPVGDYARSCVGREEAFAELARRHGASVVIIRLNYAVECRYGVLVDIADRVWRGEPVDVTAGHVNVIWQRDAVAHIIRALPLAGSPAVPLNVTGPEILEVAGLAQRFGRIWGRQARLTGSPAATVWLNDASRAQRCFGRPPTSVSTMVEWVAAWVAAERGTWAKPTGFEVRDGKF